MHILDASQVAAVGLLQAAARLGFSCEYADEDELLAQLTSSRPAQTTSVKNKEGEAVKETDEAGDSEPAKGDSLAVTC